ncbi:AraC family transcriptional regulator [Telmatospirillum sp.]|uniref:helix-turn-helix domain-containing protein n=1 Tax=Telmatospirillum sp. TaxID=2079197 RepID=UPI002846CD11|nr:AraC family transcriptional regulator [Telmatospirillum sp.]MDR3441072.1 AraC family transcriptional regulator [Telmatospirillum sp.]
MIFGSGPLRVARNGRLVPGEVLVRHRHLQAFAAVVLAGRYSEPGDSGCHDVGAGDVIFHGPDESHLDRVSARGAEVLVLPLPDQWNSPPRGRVTDADELARLAEKDLRMAVERLADMATPVTVAETDWPQRLATAIIANPALRLSDWARTEGLHLGSLSRGFRQVFEVSPKAFRLRARTHQALRLYRSTTLPGATIAYQCGFADQAHMIRSIAAVTGHSCREIGRPTDSGKNLTDESLNQESGGRPSV